MAVCHCIKGTTIITIRTLCRCDKSTRDAMVLPTAFSSPAAKLVLLLVSGLGWVDLAGCSHSPGGWDVIGFDYVNETPHTRWIEFQSAVGIYGGPDRGSTELPPDQPGESGRGTSYSCGGASQFWLRITLRSDYKG